MREQGFRSGCQKLFMLPTLLLTSVGIHQTSKLCTRPPRPLRRPDHPSRVLHHHRGSPLPPPLHVLLSIPSSLCHLSNAEGTQPSQQLQGFDHRPKSYYLLTPKQPTGAQHHLLELVEGNPCLNFTSMVEWRCRKMIREGFKMDEMELRFRFKHEFPSEMRLMRRRGLEGGQLKVEPAPEEESSSTANNI